MIKKLSFLVGVFVTALIPVCVAAADAPVRVPLLVYHHIRDTKPYPKSTWSYKMSVSPTIFEKQMQWISDHGYTPVTLDDAVAYLNKNNTTLQKPIVITFDDNNLNAYERGLPILQKHGFIAVF